MGLFTAATKRTPAYFESNPWSGQSPYLTTGFGQAQDALNNALSGVEGLDYTADMNQGQLTDLSNISNMGYGASTIGNQFMNAGAAGGGALNNYIGNSQDIYNQSSMSPSAMAAGAMEYADNPIFQDMIDSSIADVNKGLGMDMAANNAAATGGGNMNSTRAATLDSMLTDSAAKRASDISTGIRGAAYGQGLDMMNNRLGNMRSANAGVLSGANTGFDFANQGYGMANRGLADSYGANTALQTQQQNEIAGQLQAAGMPLDLVSQYMQTIGGNYGSEGFQESVTKTPSIFQTVMGAVGAAAGGGAF